MHVHCGGFLSSCAVAKNAYHFGRLSSGASRDYSIDRISRPFVLLNGVPNAAPEFFLALRLSSTTSDIGPGTTRGFSARQRLRPCIHGVPSPCRPPWDVDDIYIYLYSLYILRVYDTWYTYIHSSAAPQSLLLRTIPWQAVVLYTKPPRFCADLYRSMVAAPTTTALVHY